MNFDEAVHGAGGVIVGDDGKPNVATPEATKGLQTLTDWFKDGHIPKAAITWTEEEGRQAFQNGELIFHRNWPLRYTLANKTDGSSKVAGKFDVAPLPGITGLASPAWAVATTPSPRTPRTRARRPTSSSSWRRQSRRSPDTLATSQSADRRVAVQRSRHRQEVPLHPDAAQVDPDRQATSEGRGVR